MKIITSNFVQETGCAIFLLLARCIELQRGVGERLNFRDTSHREIAAPAGRMSPGGDIARANTQHQPMQKHSGVNRIVHRMMHGGFFRRISGRSRNINSLKCGFGCLNFVKSAKSTSALCARF